MVQLQNIESSDIKALRDLAEHTFRIAFQSVNDPIHFENYVAEFFTLETLQREWQTPGSFFLFAESGNERIGYIKLNTGKAQTEDMPHDAVELQRIYVLPEFQGKGTGTGILNLVEELARTWKASFIWLGVWEHNEGALRFYKRNGYTIFGSHDFMLGGDLQTDLLMKKDLKIHQKK